MELWGLVLGQLLIAEPLWDMQSTAQGLCSISATSKGLYAAVQQQGWPQLCRLLRPLRLPTYTNLAAKTARTGQLSTSADLLSDPISLSMPELSAACKSYGMPSAGILCRCMLHLNLTAKLCQTRQTATYCKLTISC